ncbi:MAG TPA: alkaline phosphatase family protein [Acidimicrobiales bacterium]|nr:alkaline phosphatase family protein [Acidimicrobiales bacterium]
MTLSRRRFLAAGGVGAAATLLGGTGALAHHKPNHKPPGRPSPPPPLIDPAACPVDTVVVCMMENRSFDHYLGVLPGVDGLRSDMWNPDRDGERVYVHDLGTDTVAWPDPSHSWSGGRRQLNGGAMDGFVVTTGSHEPMGYYTSSTIPWLQAFAPSFTIFDAWFCSHLGNTWPNRNYLHAAQDFGYTSNDSGDGYPAALSIYEQLDLAGVSWKYYFIDLPFLATYDRFPQWVEEGKIGTVADYLAEAIAGRLPSVAMVDPAFFVNDDHPPADVQLGQRFMADVYGALAAGPHWASSALFVTYDEWGGFYDHVVPPRFPDLRPSDNIDEDHSQAGFRVPTVLAGPYARRGAVVSEPMDHASITKFIEWRFGLPSLTPRDAAAVNPAAVAFDFASPDLSLPELPLPKIDPVATATSVAAVFLGENPVPELTEVATARVPAELLQLPETGIAIPTFDRSTGLVGELFRVPPVGAALPA